jgi:hypothetical protein
MNAFTRSAVALGLRQLFEKPNFFISDLDTLMKLAGVHMPSAQYDALRVLHCMKWGDMPHHVRQGVMDQVVELFGSGPTFDLTELDKVAGFSVSDDIQPSERTITFTVPPQKKKLFGLLKG